MLGKSRRTKPTCSILLVSSLSVSRRGLMARETSRLLASALSLALLCAGLGPSGVAGAADPAESVPAAAKAHSDARRAAELYDEGDWAGAVDLYASALAVNPHRGNQWDAYASALHSLGRYEESLAAWERCAALGYRTGGSLYNCACAEARLGRKDQALDRLAAALDEGYWDEAAFAEDEDLAAIRSHSRFAELTGAGVRELDDRDARWRYDLDFLSKRIEQIHWAPFEHVSRDSFREVVADIKEAASDRSDGEMTVAIRRLLALIGDGHTLLLGDGDAMLADPLTGRRAAHGGGPSFSRYPVAFALFSDGLFVVRAAEPLRDVVGARVVKVGGVDANDALSRITPYCPVDNEMGLMIWGPYLLASPDVADAAGLTERSGAMILEVESDDGQARRVTVSADSAQDTRSEWVSMLPSDDALPPTLRDRDRAYWFEPLDGTRFVYLQFNQTRDDPADPLESFWSRLFAVIDQANAEGLVIDLRNNFGGNKALFEPLVEGIRRSDRINERDRLFVIVGRRTFSAAMCGAAWLEKSTRATFVGEPTGSRPNFVGEITRVTLPYSRFELSISSRYHQNAESTEGRTWIGPHIAAVSSSRDWVAGRDPAIDAIRAYIAATAEAAR